MNKLVEISHFNFQLFPSLSNYFQVYPSKMTSKTIHTGFILNPLANQYIPLAHQKPVHTFWEDCKFLEVVPTEYSNEWEKKQYLALQKLKISSTFQQKFATFAENILCVTDTDTEKGCRIDLRATQYWHDKHNNIAGKKKCVIGFWFMYRQDGITYNVVYECDDLDDPCSGLFHQWNHDKDCCGYSCDYYGCHYAYL